MADLRYRPRPEALRALVASLHRAASPASLCILLAEQLARDPVISGVRVWTVRPGDVCDACSRRGDCEKRVSCLHLVATAGAAPSDADASDRVPFDTPLGAALSGNDPTRSSEGTAARTAVPLRSRDEAVGLVAIYADNPIPADRLAWLLLVLDAAAAVLHALRAADVYESRIEELGSQNQFMRTLIGEGAPMELAVHPPVETGRNGSSGRNGTTHAQHPDEGFMTEAQMRAFERENTRAVLEKTDWRVYGDGGAADLLGIRPTTLNSRIAKMGLRKPDPVPTT